MSSPAPRSSVVALTAASTRHRVLTVLIAFAVAAAVLVAPQLTKPAAAAPLPHNAASARVFAGFMLRVLNRERRWNGLPPLVMNNKLIASAHAHNLAMARDDMMSHQLPGEAFFADRITAAHYNWASAGENIGWNSDQTRPGLKALERDMYNEQAPDNGHRLNILNQSFRNVGIDVYFDKVHGKMWFTQDFGQPA